MAEGWAESDSPDHRNEPASFPHATTPPPPKYTYGVGIDTKKVMNIYVIYFVNNKRISGVKHIHTWGL